ncbi:A/G-specific adenine glycosylase [Paenibacillus sp. BIHB 4019]|uniref:Adenine DNA glycosylase n=1 Tax=Paenibacillus sp. BIHB 4019 TaxID=1870819 RepID=A0A1B2DCH7_9BACL|nr:A/G-specific adenine glycosylase [Paenibacillus sp. BIHB 4019]ANY65411.1 A/G-specific adenine glycosylase [Paenibacillus sp. BIHB 4019]
MTAEAKQHFSRELLHWYRRGNRDLPWRKSRDPYRIWVSEIMLQQTRVDTVIPYYERFMDKFPSVQALAEAPEPEVLKCWEGLGYYSRARNLQAGARQVMELHQGQVPDDKTAVAALKGVGPYTSGAIMSIAFNRPEPAVDGNVMRVLSRYFALEDDIAKPATRVKIEKLAAELIPEGAAGDFNQALMELGALVCTPKSPSCLPCPVMEHCEARIEGRETELPIKSKAKPPRAEARIGVIVEGSGEHEGKVLVRQRPATGLLAQMWELPHLLVPKELEPLLRFGEEQLTEQAPLGGLLTEAVAGDTGLLIRPQRQLMDADHIFSHIHWKMRVYKADLGAMNARPTAQLAQMAAEAAAVYTAAGKLAEQAEQAGQTALIEQTEQQGALREPYRWIGPEHMDELAFPNLFLKILRDYWNQDL